MKHLPVARGPERGSTVIKNKLHHLATAWSLISVRAVPVSVFFAFIGLGKETKNGNKTHQNDRGDVLNIQGYSRGTRSWSVMVGLWKQEGRRWTPSFSWVLKVLQDGKPLWSWRKRTLRKPKEAEAHDC